MRKLSDDLEYNLRVSLLKCGFTDQAYRRDSLYTTIRSLIIIMQVLIQHL